MRRLLIGVAVAAVTAAMPLLAFAGNQEMAEQIAQSLRSSGKMSDYKIGVTYQDGTAWLRGRVTSQEQMKTALRLAMRAQGVKRVVNELSIDGQEMEEAAEVTQPAAEERPVKNAIKKLNPLRKRMTDAAVQPTSRVETVHDDRVVEEEPSAVEQTSAEEPQPLLQRMAVDDRMPTSRVAQTPVRVAQNVRGPMAPNGAPMPMYTAAAHAGPAPARYDQPCLPNYAWPSYAAYPNYAAVTYPKQYSPTAWPYIGPFYPYPQVPLGWRKVTLEWDSGWWFLDFKDQPASCWHR